MEPWEVRDGEVLIDCEAANAAYEKLNARRGTRQKLQEKYLGSGHISRMRGRADGGRQRYARVQRETARKFAEVCGAKVEKWIVDPAVVRDWYAANPPDDAKSLDETQQNSEAKPPEHGLSKRTVLIAALVVLAAVILVGAAWKLIGGQELGISQLRVYDDAYRTGMPKHRTLTALHRKPAFYEITTPDEFLLALGFVISGYAKTPEGGINVTATLIGQGVNSEAWHTDVKFTLPDDWKNTDVAKSVGADDVLRQFGLRDGAAIPVIAIVECAQVDELAPWTGKIDVEVTDNVSHHTAKDSITINLNKPANLKSASNCTPAP